VWPPSRMRRSRSVAYVGQPNRLEAADGRRFEAPLWFLLSPKDAHGTLDELWRREVQSAQALSAEDRFLAGPRMFDEGCKEPCPCPRASLPNADTWVYEAMLNESVDYPVRCEVL
jgi:hypothetical protein